MAQSKHQISPVASAVAEVIEGLCDQVIARGRLAFAAMTGVCAFDVGFDQPTGRFFVLDRDRSRNVLDIANTMRSGSCKPGPPRLWFQLKPPMD
jgi:hypothetical protein